MVKLTVEDMTSGSADVQTSFAISDAVSLVHKWHYTCVLCIFYCLLSHGNKLRSHAVYDDDDDET